MKHNATFSARQRLTAFALAFGLALLALTYAAPAQAKPSARMHKIVFEMSVDGMPKWESVLRNAENVQKTFGPKNTRIEIVAHGKASACCWVRTRRQTRTSKR